MKFKDLETGRPAKIIKCNDLGSEHFVGEEVIRMEDDKVNLLGYKDFFWKEIKYISYDVQYLDELGKLDLKHEVYLDMADSLSKLSKCVSKQVACLLVDFDGNIVASGVNGTPKGYTNCCDHFPNYNPETDREAHHKWSNIHEIHAEQNTISRAPAKSQLDGEVIAYCTLEPCMSCTKLLVSYGVKEIYFSKRYDKAFDREDIEKFVKDNNIIFKCREE